jgi:hypothetical protein
MKTELVAILSLAAVLAVGGDVGGKRCASGGCLLTPEAIGAQREMATLKLETDDPQRSTAPQPNYASQLSMTLDSLNGPTTATPSRPRLRQ